MPAGRPTDYRDEFVDRVVELGKQGKHAYQIASALDIAIATLYRWAEEKPEFKDALTRAMTHSKSKAIDYIHDNISNPDCQSKLVELNAKFMNDVQYSREWDASLADPIKMFDVLLREFNRGMRSAESIERVSKVLLSRITAEQEIEIAPKIKMIEERLGITLK